jgi:hypothetical protein
MYGSNYASSMREDEKLMRRRCSMDLDFTKTLKMKQAFANESKTALIPRRTPP